MAGRESCCLALRNGVVISRPVSLFPKKILPQVPTKVLVASRSRFLWGWRNPRPARLFGDRAHLPRWATTKKHLNVI